MDEFVTYFINMSHLTADKNLRELGAINIAVAPPLWVAPPLTDVISFQTSANFAESPVFVRTTNE